MRLSILKKFFLTITALLVLTLGATDLIWFAMVRPILTTRLQESQKQIGLRARDKIEGFLNAKLRTLIVHSQSAAFLTSNHDLERLELLTLFAHDQDIQKIAVIDEKGLERLLLTKSGQSKTNHLTDRSTDPSFITTTFRYSKEYVSEVYFSENKPALTFAVPIAIPTTTQQLTELSTERKSIIRQPGEILGVIEIEVSLENLFAELTTLGTEQSGFLYIINKQGRVIAHKENKYLKDSDQFLQFPPVKDHTENLKIISNPTQANKLYQYRNEENVEVLGTHVDIPSTDWAVIVQQPTNVALADLIQVTTLALYILTSGVLIALPTSYFLSKKIYKSYT